MKHLLTALLTLCLFANLLAQTQDLNTKKDTRNNQSSFALGGIYVTPYPSAKRSLTHLESDQNHKNHDWINNIWSAYPNPTNGMLTLSQAEPTEQDLVVDILSIDLRVLHTLKNQREIDLSTFQNGLYYLIINNLQAIKIIKHD